MGHDGRQLVIKTQPHETLGKLVQREEQWHGRKQQLSPVLHLGQRGHADDSKYRTAYKVGARGKTHKTLHRITNESYVSVTAGVGGI